MKIIKIIEEAKSRLRSAIIIMKRGTIIHADHARVVKYPSGATYVVVGIDPGVHSRVASSAYHVLSKKEPFVVFLRDFFAPWRYIDDDDQYIDRWLKSGNNDQLNMWMARSDIVPGDDDYDGHRACEYTQKFSRILTINPRNIESIEWVDG